MAQLKKFFIIFFVLFSLIGGYIFFILPTKIVPIVHHVIAENSDYQFSADKLATVKFSLIPQIRLNNVKLSKNDQEINIRQILILLNLKKWVQNHFSLKNLPLSQISLFDISGNKLAIPSLIIMKNEQDVYNLTTSGIYNSVQYVLSGFFQMDRTFSFDLKGNDTKSNLTGKYENKQLTGILKIEKNNYPKNASTSVIAEITGPLKNLSFPTFQAIITYQLKQVMTISGDIQSFKPLNINFSFKGNYDKYSASGLVSINDKLFDLSQLNMRLEHTVFENADVKINLAHIPEIKASILADALNFKELAGTIYFVQNSINSILKTKNQTFTPEQYKSTDQISADRTPTKMKEQKNSFDIQRFKSANGNIIIYANQVISNLGKELGPAEIKAELQDGVLEVPVLNIGNFLNGTINAQIVGDKSITAKANLIVKNLPLATFVNNISTGSVSGIVNLETTSSTKDGLIQNANGLIKLAGQNITYVPRFKLLQQLTGSKNTKEVIFKCGVINTPVKDGVIVSDQKIAFETEKQQILLNGMIDFGNKQLDTKLKIDQAEVNLGTLLSDVSITGPFSGIRVRVDQNKAFDNLINLGFGFLKGKKKQEQIKRTLNNVCQKALQ